jgi:hypothetical protein
MPKPRKNGREKTVEPPNPPPVFPTTNPLGIRSVYINNMDMVGSSLDVRLEFFELVPDQGQLVREKRASIVMSVPHFRAMVAVFNAQLTNLAGYEAVFEKALAEKM